MDISPTVLRQLEEAQAAVAAATSLTGPPVASNVLAAGQDHFGVAASGSATVDNLLVDHYFTNTAMTLWARAANGWRHAPLDSDDEQGIAKVAFAADRVDAWWNDSNTVTMLRCWKTF
jgi:hypothetical protein